VLPEGAPEQWFHILTNEKLSVVSSQGKKLLPMSSALQNFPLALLAPDELHA
jgi:hypothetical protein